MYWSGKRFGAGKESNRGLITVSGGVSCNQELRQQMTAAAEREGVQVLFAAPTLCTDNAAMIAFAAALRLEAGFRSSVTDEIDPNLALVSSRVSVSPRRRYLDFRDQYSRSRR